MADITLRKVSGQSVDTVPNCTIITIRNFQTLDFDLSMPISTMALPEENDSKAILVKGEGNTMSISVAWTLNDQSSTISTAASVITTNEQLHYWINTLQPDSIEDSWEITVPGDTSSTNIVRGGSIRKLTFNKSSNAPTLYEGRLEFISGDAIVGEA